MNPAYRASVPSGRLAVVWAADGDTLNAKSDCSPGTTCADSYIFDSDWLAARLCARYFCF